MSVMSLHDHINVIDDSRTNWTLKLRVTRMWPSLDEEGHVLRYNLILLDCLNAHVQAIVTPAIQNEVNPQVVEGFLYEIRNIQVLQPQGFIRPTRSDKVISFLPYTVMNQLMFDDFAIPRHKFELIPLDELYGQVALSVPQTNPLYATDVIGVLMNLQPIQTVMTHGVERQLVIFSVSDGSTSIKVMFFGPLNEDTAALYNHDLQTPVIVILACVRIGHYRGSIHINNFPGSRIYINLDYPDVSDLRLRLNE